VEQRRNKKMALLEKKKQPSLFGTVRKGETRRRGDEEDAFSLLFCF
jgi:hypothetical protein